MNFIKRITKLLKLIKRASQDDALDYRVKNKAGEYTFWCSNQDHYRIHKYL